MTMQFTKVNDMACIYYAELKIDKVSESILITSAEGNSGRKLLMIWGAADMFSPIGLVKSEAPVTASPMLRAAILRAAGVFARSRFLCLLSTFNFALSFAVFLLSASLSLFT